MYVLHTTADMLPGIRVLSGDLFHPLYAGVILSDMRPPAPFSSCNAHAPCPSTAPSYEARAGSTILPHESRPGALRGRSLNGTVA